MMMTMICHEFGWSVELQVRQRVPVVVARVAVGRRV